MTDPEEREGQGEIRALLAVYSDPHGLPSAAATPNRSLRPRHSGGLRPEVDSLGAEVRGPVSDYGGGLGVDDGGGGPSPPSSDFAISSASFFRAAGGSTNITSSRYATNTFPIASRR